MSKHALERATQPAASRSVRRVPRGRRTPEVEEMIRRTDHFGHREAAGIVVDLFWDRRHLHDEFRVEVKDRRDGTRFVLYLATGREAIHAFHHPFSAPAGNRTA